MGILNIMCFGWYIKLCLSKMLPGKVSPEFWRERHTRYKTAAKVRKEVEAFKKFLRDKHE